MDESVPILPVNGGGVLLETSAPRTFVLCVLPPRAPGARQIELPRGAKITGVVTLDDGAEGRAAAEAVAARAGLPNLAVYAGAQLDERLTFGPLALVRLEGQAGVLSATWTTRPHRILIGARVDLARFAANALAMPVTHVFGGLAVDDGVEAAQRLVAALRSMGLPSLVLDSTIADFKTEVADALRTSGLSVDIVE